MSQESPSTGNAPSAETFKERVDQLGAESDLGAGNQEPDPATAENPPQESSEGDAKRNPA